MTRYSYLTLFSNVTNYALPLDAHHDYGLWTHFVIVRAPNVT